VPARLLPAFAQPPPVDRIPALFARHNIRCTAQREAVYSALEATESHPTALELHGMVAKKAGGISLATVYNTLELLTRKGLTRRYVHTSASTGGREEAARYDADTRSHIHFIDDQTGRLRDIPADLGVDLLSKLPADVIEQIEDRLGVRIDQVRIELHGDQTGSQAC